MIYNLIIVCKETIKYMWNILIVYFLNKHSCYKYINLKHIKKIPVCYTGDQHGI